MDQRLIPAHAGKTKKRPRLMASKRAHPRSRGENSTPRPASRWTTGSSPLTRGKPRRTPTRGRTRGLIPAHAGKTLGYPVEGGPRRAHPRSRGENIVDKPNVLAGLGSSPLTRGKPSAKVTTSLSEGLIPAHAGKTRSPGRRLRCRRAHPRSRGENCYNTNGNKGVTGSSPLTRGKRSGSGLRGWSVGLIPAHAGKTALVIGVLKARGAHPRSRGENVGISLPEIVDWGSSPLTRGKPHTRRGPSNRSGLIPAHAGKTSLVSSGGARVRAHPRSRGENP